MALRKRFLKEDSVGSLMQSLALTKQEVAESARAYATRLRVIGTRITEKVPEKSNELLQAQLLAQFIAGLRSNEVRRALLFGGISDFDKAVSVASEVESKEALLGMATMVNAVQLPSQSGKIPSNEMMRRERTQGQRNPERRTCFHCHKVGHIARNCFTRKREMQRQGPGNVPVSSPSPM